MSVLASLSLSVLLHAAPATSPVADAAKARDAAAVRALLKQGGDVNGAQGDGMTALHWAAMQGDAELAGMLLYAGANWRATTRLGGYTPLHLASQSGAAPVVRTLLDGGADADARTSTGATALMLAAKAGSVDAVTGLLDKGADTNATESAYGQTALMIAAALDRADVTRVLLERGADPRIASKFTDLAALTAPADPDRQPQGGGAGARPAAAAEGGERRPDVPGVTRPFRYNELIGAQGGLTALHMAARQGSALALRALVEGGADVNQASPGDRTTPLLIATVNGHFDIASYLLDKGADPNLASAAGATPLYGVVNVQWAPKAAYPQPRAHLQQTSSYLDLMKALLEKGADPNARVRRKVWFASYNFDQSSVDEVGATAFWRAAYASDVAAMKLLVGYGADPNIPTMKAAGRSRPADGDPVMRDVSTAPPMPVGGPSVTPLQAAAGVGYGQGFAGNSHHVAPAGMMAAVTYLVDDLGADVNASDGDGNTALHHAASRGDNEMILFLVSKGADVTTVNRAGQSTVDLANGPVQRIQPFPETIALLEKLGAKNHHKCVSC
ncbi:MAG: ankyrin repeat domain-containing protein [Acidobacteria bacterium]|nr:ankyrin repeat domain-containing protein [Acidobacteriota bacterium]